MVTITSTTYISSHKISVPIAALGRVGISMFVVRGVSDEHNLDRTKVLWLW